MQSWTSTGSYVTNCRFSPIIDTRISAGYVQNPPWSLPVRWSVIYYYDCWPTGTCEIDSPVRWLYHPLSSHWLSRPPYLLCHSQLPGIHRIQWNCGRPKLLKSLLAIQVAVFWGSVRQCQKSVVPDTVSRSPGEETKKQEWTVRAVFTLQQWMHRRIHR